MDAGQVALVQRSFGAVAPRGAEVARVFYAMLFDTCPELRALFGADMERQGLKLMAALRLAVQGLEAPERAAPALERLGRAHLAYGVRDEHYAQVGAALLGALERVLGEEFTPATGAAWAAAYETLSRVMRAAATEEAFGLALPTGLRS